MGHSSRYRPQKAYLERNGGAEKVSRTKRNRAGASLANQLIADDAAL